MERLLSSGGLVRHGPKVNQDSISVEGGHSEASFLVRTDPPQIAPVNSDHCMTMLETVGLEVDPFDDCFPPVFL
jgi:hypothetical protein